MTKNEIHGLIVKILTLLRYSKEDANFFQLILPKKKETNGIISIKSVRSLTIPNLKVNECNDMFV